MKQSSFVLNITDRAGEYSVSWRPSEMGVPNQRRLELYVSNFIASLSPTGHNSHLAQMYGFVPLPLSAQIVNRRTGEVIAQYVRHT